METPPVHLSLPARRRACDVIVETLQFHDIEVVIVSVDDHHFHVLARFPDLHPRKWIGIAKKESARDLSSAGLVQPGGVWAVRCKVTPICDRHHQVTVANYIAKHADRGAAIWRLQPHRGANKSTSVTRSE